MQYMCSFSCNLHVRIYNYNIQYFHLYIYLKQFFNFIACYLTIVCEE